MDKQAQDKLYRQHDFAITMHEAHPEDFSILTDEEMELLREVYLIDRDDIDINETDIDSHIAAYLEQNPDAIERLNPVIHKLADRFDIPKDTKDELIF